MAAKKNKTKGKPSTALGFQDVERQRRWYSKRVILHLAMECEVLGGRGPDLVKMVHEYGKGRGWDWLYVTEPMARIWLQKARDEFRRTEEKSRSRLRARYMARFERLYALAMRNGELDLAVKINQTMAQADGVLENANKEPEERDTAARGLGRIADKLKQALQRGGAGGHQADVRKGADTKAGEGRV